MEKGKLLIAQKAIGRIALQEGKTVEQVRQEISHALTAGMLSPDPKVQAYWRKIPHEKEVPSPEEVIVFLSEKARDRYKIME